MGRSDFPRIKEIIRCLKDEYTLSSNPNSRKGGLVGLAAIAIALGRVSAVFMSMIYLNFDALSSAVYRYEPARVSSACVGMF